MQAHQARQAVDLQASGDGVHATQQRLQAGQQFGHREGLGQVVVGTHLQAQDAVHLGAAGAGNEDGRVACDSAGAAAYFQPVDAGQHEVQHDGIPAAALQQRQALAAIGGMFHRIAVSAQMHAQDLGQVHVVFHQQDAFDGFCHLHLSRMLQGDDSLVGCVRGKPPP